MKRFFCIMLVLLCFVGVSNASDYKSTIDSWTSYEDVVNWLKNNWRFDQIGAKKMVKIIKTKGADAAIVKSAEETFNDPKGWCKDSANFAKESLNLVNADYKAQYIFIQNKIGNAPNHWVTGFKSNGQIYVIDYGAGSHWEDMMGFHGPYASLDEYGEFLSNLNIRNFELDFVRWISDSTKAGVSQKAKRRAIIVLAKFDKNGDGGIDFSEAPRPMKQNFQRLDKNGDEKLDEEELAFLPPR